jgi:PST family polysaccharide transporter
MKDLKQRTIRGGAAKISSQAASFVLRMGSLMVLARLLDPKDFGLVGMVTAVIGVFNVFKDFGLSAAAVQRSRITQEQASTLFWINILVGATLGVFTVAIAPLIAAFYHEQRLFGVTAVMATAFLFNAAGVQHASLLERQMRFTTLSLIDVGSMLVSTAVGVAMAIHGFGYWSLVATTVVTPLIFSICVWLTARWVPGRPHRQVGIGSMMRFGGTLTVSGLVMYFASNFDKILLGRFWGVESLGIYGRAYQLINIPTDNLNSAAGTVTFAALSRLQAEPSRLRSYFLKGYSLVLSLSIPIALTCALFAQDMILVFLGPKWKSAAIVFRLLVPTTLVYAIINPLGWLLSSLGMVSRGLKISLVLGPVMIAGYLLGLPYGPKGVAFAYSAVMVLCVFPLVAWAIRGTVVSLHDILLTVGRPFISGIVATAIAFGVQRVYGPLLSPIPRLTLGVCIVFSIYLTTLMYVMGQKLFFLDILRTFGAPASVEETSLV